jgi:hypothetical protein
VARINKHSNLHYYRNRIAFKTKKELNGVFHSKKPLPPTLSPIIGLALSVCFNMLLFNVIDPGAKDTIKELTIKYMVTTMEN